LRDAEANRRFRNDQDLTSLGPVRFGHFISDIMALQILVGAARVFDIVNARDFYQKLLEDFDDFMRQPDSARHAMNCAITAHHMADWVWGDFVKSDAALKARLGVGYP
jgi:hypothetical protein